MTGIRVELRLGTFSCIKGPSPHNMSMVTVSRAQFGNEMRKIGGKLLFTFIYKSYGIQYFDHFRARVASKTASVL